MNMQYEELVFNLIFPRKLDLAHHSLYLGWYCIVSSDEELAYVGSGALLGG
jgi:hypothetical protein